MILSRKPILMLALLFASAIGINAQCVATTTDPCIAVHQSILDRASKLADTLKAAEDALAKQANALGATDVERKAWLSFKETADWTIGVLQKGIADRETLITLQQKALELYSTLVEKLTAQLNKPRSAWQKFIGAVEKIIVFAAGAAIGRGP